MGIKPTTSGLDLPSLCRLSYKVAQRKSGTYFLFAAIHHLKSSPTFSVRPCCSVGRVMVDLIRRLWIRFTEVKRFFLCLVAPCFPLLGLTPSGLFMGLSSTIIYTSELILCSTIYVAICCVQMLRSFGRGFMA